MNFISTENAVGSKFLTSFTTNTVENGILNWSSPIWEALPIGINDSFSDA